MILFVLKTNQPFYFDYDFFSLIQLILKKMNCYLIIKFIIVIYFMKKSIINFVIVIAFLLKKEMLFIINANYFIFSQFFHSIKQYFKQKMTNSNFLSNFFLFSQKHFNYQYFHLLFEIFIKNYCFFVLNSNQPKAIYFFVVVIVKIVISNFISFIVNFN